VSTFVCGVRHCERLAVEALQIQDFPVCALHGRPLRAECLALLTHLRRPGQFWSTWHSGPIVLDVEPLTPEHLVPWARQWRGEIVGLADVTMYLNRTFTPAGWR
jgi:hypothetical protein